MSALSIEKLIAGVGHGYGQVFAGYLGVKSGIKTPDEVSVFSRELAADQASPGEVMAAFSKVYGMTTSDIAEASEALVHTLVKKFPQTRHRRLTKFIEAADFRKNHILSAFEDVKPSSTYQESQEIPSSIVSDFEHQTTQTKRYPTRVIVTYETLRNQTDWVNTVPAAILNSLYREEAQSLYAMLEANPVLEDGNPLFYGDNTAVLGLLNYKIVLELFRAQKTSKVEHIVGYEPKYLVVPAPDEAEIRAEVKLTGMGEIEIFARADITSLYLLADPEITPTIIRLGISETPSVSVSPVPNMSRSIAITGDNDFSFAPVSRYGICRLSPT